MINGADPKQWGPCLWNFLFISIIGRFPDKIDFQNEEHVMIVKYFKNFIYSFQVVLPCIYCRKSFSFFTRQSPLTDNVMSGKKSLLYWVYTIKDKINKKLISQEQKNYANKRQEIDTLLNNKIITQEEYRIKLNILNNLFKTTPSPSFETVLENYYNKI